MSANNYDTDWFSLPRRYWVWLLVMSVPVAWLKGGTRLVLDMLFCYVVASILAWGLSLDAFKGSRADEPTPARASDNH